ncbi:MAG TPA: ribulose-phosphate 3-epimerase [Acidimicrobiia bacterium]|nr:ribulose-phosphate 3-epimerase [Acidimicrobiia bacterium]
MRPVKIAPSLLAADFARLGEQVAKVAPHVESLHLDVMDGHFVPNLSFGIPVIAALRRETDLHFDCHLMTTNPDAYVDELAEAGANLLTMHIEAAPDPTRAAERTRRAGLEFGLVLNPATPFAAVKPFVELCDLLLIMSVEPGFGGQEFMPEVLPKLEDAREWVESQGLAVDIQIDGGMSPETAPRARAAGANVFVAGSAIFGSPDPAGAADRLRQAIEDK